MTKEQIDQRLADLIKANTSRGYQLRIAAHQEKVAVEKKAEAKEKSRRAYWAKRYWIRKSGYTSRRRQIY